MNLFGRRLAISLFLCNIASAGINFLSIIFYSWSFGLLEIGMLATLTSVSTLLMPLINFRLDLAFQRLSAHNRPGLTALIVVWGGCVGLVVLLVLLFLHFALGWQSLLIVWAIPLHLSFSAANSAIWAQKICDRRLGEVVVLQVFRSLLAAALPFVLSLQFDSSFAIIGGQVIAQLTFLLFLPALRNFGFRNLCEMSAWTRTESRDLLIDNTLPLLVNTASLHLNPLVAAALFGPEAAAIIWLIFRLFLTPASLIADPIRRDFFANFTDGHSMTRDARRSIVMHKCAVIGVGLLFLVVVLVGILFSNFASKFFFSLGHPLILFLGFTWAGAIVFNAPSTGFIPVLRMARLQTAVEIIGFVARVGSLLLGVVGVTMAFCIGSFLVSTIFINLGFGLVIDWRIWNVSTQRKQRRLSC